MQQIFFPSIWMDILTTILCKDLSIDIWQDILSNILHPRILFYDGYAYTRLFLYHMQYVNNAHVYSYIQYDIFISRMNLWWICNIALVYSYVQHDIALPRMSLRNVCHIQHDIFIHTATKGLNWTFTSLPTRNHTIQPKPHNPP